MERIIPFLIRAEKATYAGNGSKTVACRPNSHDLPYREEDLYYYDTYLGGSCFTGEEAVWIKEVPYWAMNYSGRLLNPSFSFGFLKEALLHISPEKPFRGPDYYQNGKFVYKCTSSGSFDWFQGYEEIFYLDDKIYECCLHGGLIK